MQNASGPVFSSLGDRLQPPIIAALMNAALENPDTLSLAAGFTDTATLPVDEVRAAVDRLSERAGSPGFLQYGPNQGRPRLREWLAARTRDHDGEAGVGVDTAGTVIGSGSQQLLYLAMQVLCDPGDIVLVERPTYFVFLEMLSGMGVRAVSMPCLASGDLDLEGTAALLADLRARGETKRIKAVYLMSYFANPSARSMDVGEKRALAALLEREGLVVPVLEDAAYRELWFRSPWPASSVMVMPEWQAFPRMFMGTLTKPFATGLKIGFAHVADPAWRDRMLWLKGHHDFGSAHFNQAVLEDVLLDGGLDRHLQILRASYAAKMEALDEALVAAGLRDRGWIWDRPEGGLYLWLRGPDGVDTSPNGTLWKACLEEGVLYVPGGVCMSDVPGHRHVRLSFGVLDPDALREAAGRFSRAAEHAARGR